MTLKTSAAAMSLMTLIQMLPSIVSHQSPQIMNTTHPVTVAWILMTLVMTKKTAMFMVMTAEASNHVVRIGYLSYETIDTLKVKK